MKTVLITGANSEIGFCIVESFYQKGWNIICTDVEGELMELEEKIKNITTDTTRSNNIIFRPLNLLANNAKVEIDHIIEGHPIHTLINVAGINILKRFLSFTEEDFRNILTINATNTLLLSQVITENMIRNNLEGNIVFIGSQHGIVANHNRVPYSISKSILIHVTKSLSLELSPFSIRVNCVSPTFIQTEKNKALLEDSLFKAEALDRIPLRKYGLPKDVMEAVMFLIDEKSAMITGHNLVVDGGWTIQ